MQISSALITAFLKLVQSGSFSRAAVALGITQPALTKRIQLLETCIGQPLIIRNRKGTQMTDAGREFLRYSETVSNLENDLLKRFGVAGTSVSVPLLRVGGSASLIHPLVIPALAPLVKRHENATVEFYVRENPDLTTMLLRGQIDYVVSDADTDRRDQESIKIGTETIVAIESAGCRESTYLDADIRDDFTDRYLSRVIGKVTSYRRALLQDEHGIIEGVRNGYGRALVHSHMLAKMSGLSIVAGSKRVKVPVFVVFRKQEQYSHWHHQVVSLLKSYAPTVLN